MSHLEPLLVVARRLGDLRDRVVFVGGMVRGLLVTDAGATPERPTDDVDLVVELTSTAAYHRLGVKLRALGFREDTTPGAPIVGDLVDDIGNLAFLGRLRNIRNNDENPWDYFQGVDDRELREDFLIEDRTLLAADRFAEFAEKRRTLLVDRVKAFLGRFAQALPPTADRVAADADVQEGTSQASVVSRRWTPKTPSTGERLPLGTPLLEARSAEPGIGRRTRLDSDDSVVTLADQPPDCHPRRTVARGSRSPDERWRQSA